MDQVDNWLVRHGVLFVVDDLLDACLASGVIAGFPVAPANLFCGEVGKQPHGFEITLIQAVIRLRAQTAEHAVDAAIIVQDRNASMRSDRHELCDWEVRGKWLLRRVRNELWQPPLDDMAAVDIVQRTLFTNADKLFEPRSVDMTKHRIISDKFREISDRHAEMFADGIKRPVDDFIASSVPEWPSSKQERPLCCVFECHVHVQGFSDYMT